MNILNLIKSETQLASKRKEQSFVVIGLAAWLSLFLVLVGPFDMSSVGMTWRIRLTFGYIVLFLIVYGLCFQVQQYVYHRYNRWSWSLEIGFLCLFFLLSLFPAYVYYKSWIVLGESDFLPFVLKMYVPTMLLLLPFAASIRWMVGQRSSDPQVVKFYSDNKRNFIQLSLKKLLYIRSLDNYVEFYFLTSKGVSRKVLRSTLKRVEIEIPQLIRVHRSYLINRDNALSWKDKNTLTLGEAEIPVSKTYRSSLDNIL